MMDFWNQEEFIAKAFMEDTGDGDHTSLACIPPNAHGKAVLLVKEAGVLSGMKIAEQIFKFADEKITFESFLNDGDIINPGDKAFIVTGSVQAILRAERVALNCMQRLSGVATHTKRLVNLLDGLHTKLLDTRKTTPGLRFLEKQAVKHGGGENHRYGLYDMIMLKDNHIDYAGGIEKAIIKVHQYLKKHNKTLKIEVEARNFEELDEILRVGQVNRIMLDNFSVEDLKKAIERIDGKYETEASGGITEATLRKYAETGVDYISVGALTHQIKSIDLSLKAIK
jgi:nicotinate-nucleotide pyrophosphorylase (carboxylating)